MATFKPLYAAEASVTVTGFNSLANGSTATSNAVDNSSNLYQDYNVRVNVAGTAATTAWLEVRLLTSPDNSNFDVWESGIPLGVINLSATPQQGNFSLLNILYQAPKYFKIAIKNNTGAALSGSGNTVNVQGVQIQSV